MCDEDMNYDKGTVHYGYRKVDKKVGRAGKRLFGINIGAGSRKQGGGDT